MNRRVALLALAVGAAPATAQQAPGDAYELGPIVVTAPAAGVVSTMIVSEQDIARRGARTLDEALALLPGVAIHTGADGVPRIDVRGLRPRQVRVLVNGVPLNSTYDGQFDPTMIPTEDIAALATHMQADEAQRRLLAPRLEPGRESLRQPRRRKGRPKSRSRA